MNRTAVSVLLLLLAVGGLAFAQASSNGRAADDAARNQGCTCHSSAPNPGTSIQVKGLPPEYQPGSTYSVVLQSDTDVLPNPTRNLGGFLAVASAGSLAPPPGEKAWYRNGQLSDGRPFVGHNLQGAEDNVFQEWRFAWTAPDPGVGEVTIALYVNRVNGDAQATPDDHWNLQVQGVKGPKSDPGTTSTSTSQSGTTTTPPESSPSMTTTSQGPSSLVTPPPPAPDEKSAPAPNAFTLVLAWLAVGWIVRKRIRNDAKT